MSLKQSFDAMRWGQIDAHNYPPAVAERLMSIFMHEEFLAEIADRMLSEAGRPTAAERKPLGRTYLEGTVWLYGDERFDFSPYPEVLDYIQRLEKLRLAILGSS
ncbi:MAG: hypothetical protein KC609_05170 [Myxococcales bacterium]|nr:hypothetical protein [Myxococcales bacterium]